VKHYVVTSPLAGVSKRVYSLLSKPSEWRYPELRALFREEQALFAVLPGLVTRDAKCLDIGAHIGSFAYRLDKLAPQGTLTLIEALPHKARLLRRRFPNATVLETAVSDSDGTATFFENLDQSGFSSLANRASRGRTVAREVPQARIDTLMPDAEVDFIKIDVEGFEFAALQGAAQLIARSQPTIVFEAGATVDSDLEGDQGDDLFSLLTDTHGYRVWSVAGYQQGDDPLDLQAFRRCRTYPFQAFNFVAMPRDAGLQGGAA
jgi:FkbM family methyltransferase